MTCSMEMPATASQEWSGWVARSPSCRASQLASGKASEQNADMSTPLRLEGLLLACILLGVTSCRSLSASLSFQESVAQVFAEVHSSVVTLRTTSRGPSVETGGAFAELDGNGSGVLINADGDILTAAHVVQGADEIEAVFFDNRSIPARVISSDPISDIALVRLQGELPEGVRPARTGDSTTVHVGQQVFVVGAPLGISHLSLIHI